MENPANALELGLHHERPSAEIPQSSLLGFLWGANTTSEPGGEREVAASGSIEAYPPGVADRESGLGARIRTSGRKLAAVPVVEPADLGLGNHLPHGGWFNGPRFRPIVVQRPMCSRCVVVRRIATKNP